MDPLSATQSSNMGAYDPAFSAYFGNTGFQVAPSQTGEVSNTFQTIPYVSIESLITSQGSAQVDPTNVLSGQNQGQQNIQGSYTITDSNGLGRMVMGYSPGGF